MATKKIPNKTDQILVIVESPTKAKELTPFFKELGYTHIKVLASKGHITLIKDDQKSYYNTGISPDKDFKVNYVVDPGKKKDVEELKKYVEKADFVFLMTDPDREGSAISTHLKRVLKIPESKYYRITIHEITKAAVAKALESLGKIDDNLSNSAIARQIVDKLEGYRLSPIARKCVGAKSVGRCQSPTLNFVVEREEEILNFKPVKYWELYLLFTKNKSNFKAKYIGTAKKEVKKFDSLDNCMKVYNECNGKSYTINQIEVKKVKDSPKPPFTTSTYQMEANKVLGISVDTAMNCAQKLFETGKITYHRTDDDNMDPGFLSILQDYITTKYGKKYCGTLKQGKKAENQQAGHEALRVTTINLTPDKFAEEESDQLLCKVYKLIYLRTIQSTMSPAIIADTQYTIENGEHLFMLHSKEIEFDGYRITKTQNDDNIEEEVVKESFIKGEELKNTSLSIEDKTTTPPDRYTEATLVHKLEESGIGRPSTYAALIKTLLSDSRGYCKIESKKIVPTELGIQLSHFLKESFSDFTEADFTKEMESKLDLISEGKLHYIDFLKSFYNNLEECAKKVSPQSRKAPAQKLEKKCPMCGKPLVIRHGPKGDFVGCSGWRPNNKGCNYIGNLEDI